MHKGRKNIGSVRNFEPEFRFIWQVKKTMPPHASTTFDFVPLAPLGGHFNCGI
jgi:hypothetical protein